MAATDSDKYTAAASAFAFLPITRQLAVLVGLSASVGLGIAIALWSQGPNYKSLYQNLSPGDASAVSDALSKSGINFEVDNNSGAILVASNEMYRARMALAQNGLPKGENDGFSGLNQNQSFTTSQFMEKARYMYALEGELSRTVSSFAGVKKSRVHLAMAKQSVFVQDVSKASASVFVELYPGRQLTDEQVSSIVSLISSSVPNMAGENVTVVDQKGNLLTSGSGTDSLSQSNRQLKYTQQIEQNFSKKIEDLLTPIYGVGKVKSRVSADVDFTEQEQTKELFDPDSSALRSEQSLDEKKSDKSSPGGVPGASSNNAAKPATTTTTTAPGTDINNQRNQFVKNYELDKIISHTTQQTGKIRRLSVAVLIDNPSKFDPETKEEQRVQLSAEDLARAKQLVSDAIGFDIKRGDTVSVVNGDFVQPKAIEALPPLPIYEQVWFWSVLKNSIGGALILVLLLGVLRPAMRNLTNKGLVVGGMLTDQLGEGSGSGKRGGGRNVVSSGGPGGANNSNPSTDNQEFDAISGALLSYEDQMRAVKNLATDDPKRVAQVVKRWLDKDR